MSSEAKSQDDAGIAFADKGQAMPAKEAGRKATGHVLRTCGQAWPGRHGGRISQQHFSGLMRGGLGASGGLSGAGGGNGGHLAQSVSHIRTCSEPQHEVETHAGGS